MSDQQPPVEEYLLPAEAAETIFRKQIVGGALLTGGVPQPHPVIVVVAAPPGAGKTTMISAILDHLAATRGGAVELSGDPFKSFHPQWAALTRADDTFAGAATAADGRRWRGMAQEHLMEQRVDLVVETAGRTRDDLEGLTESASRRGYRAEVVMIPTPAAVSRLAILDRFAQMRQAYGRGRMVTPPMHDSSYIGIGDAARRLDRSPEVDALHVVRRGGVVLYSNQSVEGRWRHPAGAAVALDRARSEWSSLDQQRFEQTIERLAATPLTADWQAQLTEIRRLAHSVTVVDQPATTARAVAAAFPPLAQIIARPAGGPPAAVRRPPQNSRGPERL